jgi:hypothetical protein
MRVVRKESAAVMLMAVVVGIRLRQTRPHPRRHFVFFQNSVVVGIEGVQESVEAPPAAPTTARSPRPAGH